MSKFLVRTVNGSGIIDVSSESLGRGGEGEVFAIDAHNVPNLPSASDLVFKKYYQPEEGDRQPKLITMLKNAPNNDSLAWPLGLVFDGSKRFHGYIMKKLDFDSYRPWSEFAHARERKRVTPEFDLKYGMTSILNFARAVETVNSIDFFIGDLNESNAFVSNTAMVFLVDLDAGQITDERGKTYICRVGKPEFTAPEISHGSFEDNPRTPATEVFALAVAAWQMLTGGGHPTDGIFKGRGDPPAVIEKIREGIFPALVRNRSYGLPSRIPVDGIPERLKPLFIAAMSIDPSVRPTIRQFIEVFEDVNDNLVKCPDVDEHWYDGREGSCGWCEHINKGGLDPWSDEQLKEVKSQTAQAENDQTALPSLSFSSSAEAPPARSQRTPPPSQQAQQMYPGQSPGGLPMHGQHPGLPQQPPSGYPQQAHPGLPQQTSPGYPQQYPHPPEPEEKKPPEFIKGKTVLTYTDGSWSVRPPIGHLIRTDFSTAVYCIKKETPWLLRFWWDIKTPIMDKIYGAVGVVLAILFSVSWFFTVPLLSTIFSDSSIAEILTRFNLWFIWGAVSAATSLFASLYLYISGLWDRRKFFKSQGRTAIPKLLSPVKTVLKFIFVSIFYGPLFILLLFFGLIFSAVSALLSNVRI